MINTVLLDIDVTILDSETSLLTSLKKALIETLNLDIPLCELEPIMGLHETQVVSMFTNQTKKQKDLMNCWSYYVRNNPNPSSLFKNVETTLKYLKKEKIKLGIVTSKTHEHMDNDFNKLNLNYLFDIIVTSDHITHPKPHPEPIEYALKQLNSQKKTTIYIGDSLSDYECAKAADVLFYLATWGVKADSPLHKLNNKLQEFSDLITLVQYQNI